MALVVARLFISSYKSLMKTNDYRAVMLYGNTGTGKSFFTKALSSLFASYNWDSSGEA